MLDTKKPLRIAVLNALDGLLFYNAVNVPVYDEKVKTGESPRLYVVLSTQQETDIESNDSTWITQSGIDLEIVHKTGSEVSKNPIDEVYEDILEIIMPSIGTTGVTIPAAFQFLNLRRDQSITQAFEIGATESIIVTRFKLVFTIIQK